MPATGIAAQLVAFAAELRSEGVNSGTAELLDAVAVLEQIPWTDPLGFREALAATLAKSQEDRRIFELVFERFFFRATEAAAIVEGVKEGGAGGVEGGEGGVTDGAAGSCADNRAGSSIVDSSCRYHATMSCPAG